MRTYKKAFSDGRAETGEWSLFSIREYRMDKPFRYTEFDNKDTTIEIIYEYEGDLTDGLLMYKFEVHRKKVKKKMVRDTTVTSYFYEDEAWKPFKSITTLNEDTMYISTYQFDNSGYQTEEIRYNQYERPLSKMANHYNKLGHCTKLKNYVFYPDTQVFLLENEYRVDYDYNKKEKLLGIQVYFKNYGESWHKLEQMEVKANGKYQGGSEYPDREKEFNFNEYKFEHDFH